MCALFKGHPAVGGVVSLQSQAVAGCALLSWLEAIRPPPANGHAGRDGCHLADSHNRCQNPEPTSHRKHTWKH